MSDTCITLQKFNTPPGTLYCTNESYLYLSRGHRYRLEKIGSVAGINSPGGYLPPLKSRKESVGEWKIQVRGGAATLVLTGDNGGEDYYRIEKASWDSVKLNGNEYAWTRL